VQRATAQSKTGFFRDYGVAEAPPGVEITWRSFHVSHVGYGLQLHEEAVPVWIVCQDLEILSSNQTDGTQTIFHVWVGEHYQVKSNLHSTWELFHIWLQSFRTKSKWPSSPPFEWTKRTICHGQAIPRWIVCLHLEIMATDESDLHAKSPLYELLLSTDSNTSVINWLTSTWWSPLSPVWRLTD
jgi:hypothetical protein